MLRIFTFFELQWPYLELFFPLLGKKF